MSESVTNVEIEDVLASIRRLVSDDGREEESAPAAPSKLVLTPSLRVEGFADLDRASTSARPAAAPKAPDEAPHILTSPISEPDIEPVAAFPSAEEMADDLSAQAVSIDTSKPEEVFMLEDEVESEAEVGIEAASETAKRTPLEDRIASMEAVIGDTMDQWEPDGEDVSNAYSGSASDYMVWEDHNPAEDTSAEAYDASGEVINSDDIEPVPEEDTEDLDDPQPTAEDVAGFAAPELEEPVEEPLEDLDEDLDAAGFEETPSFRHVEPSPVAEPTLDDPVADTAAAEAAPFAEDDEDALDLAEESLLDEEALRELVADIVRQELQGALGERITRNVRKLVRREIHRALTAQDLQ